MLRVVFVALLLALPVRVASAQAVEEPIPFDSAGRVMALTPLMAARLELGPPAWRITGEFTEARLFRVGGGTDAFVIVVTRRGGVVERYPIGAAERAYLRQRAATLPPGFEIRPQALARNAFVRNQTLLGLGVYAPSFAKAVTNETAGQVATYLLVAGASYFAAASFARDWQVTGPMNELATHAALHGGGAGLGITYNLDAHTDGQAAGIFVGSLAGTAAGLYFGRTMTPAMARGAGYAANATALLGLGAIYASGSGDDGTRVPSRSEASILVAAGLLGYPLGQAYGSTTAYNVTTGDLSTLWVTGAIGTLAGGAAVQHGTRTDQRTALGLMTGFVAGVVAGDFLLVQRYDHTDTEAALLGLGATGGGLMGAGLFVLLDQERTNDALAMALGTAGAIGGLAITKRLVVPKVDATARSAQLRFTPAGLALAAGKVEGSHPVLQIRF